MPSSTVENYLKQIYLEQQQVPEADLVPMGRLAGAMRVVPGTATSMVKALADGGLVDYEPRGGVRLTPNGRRLALRVLRRHRLIELFLVRVVKLDWSEVHAEAEELEHAVSEKVLEKIDALLGRPSVDPHGDPIPSPAGEVPAVALESMADLPPGRPARVARVLDQDAEFLRFVERCGLTPGAAVQVTARDPAADSVTVRPEGREAVSLGPSAAGKILVERK